MLIAREKGKAMHSDCSPSKMKKNEEIVQDISSCLNKFKFDPFDQTLRSHQSGITALDALTADNESAKNSGQSKVKKIMDERVYSKSKSLNERVPQSNRKNLSTQDLKQADVENLKERIEKMKCKALESVLELLENSSALRLKDVPQNCLISECFRY